MMLESADGGIRYMMSSDDLSVSATTLCLRTWLRLPSGSAIGNMVMKYYNVNAFC